MKNASIKIKASQVKKQIQSSNVKSKSKKVKLNQRKTSSQLKSLVESIKKLSCRVN